MHTFIVQIPLPFLLPIRNGLSLVSIYPSYSFRCMFLRRRGVDISDGAQHQFYEHSLLSITLGTMKSIPEDHDRNEHFRYFMSRIIVQINKVIAAFRRNNSYANIRNISIVDLPLVLPIRYDDENMLYVANPHKFFDDQFGEVDSQELNKIGTTIATWDKYPDQVLPDQLFDLAQGSLFREDFPIAIIQLQSSFEVFIDNCIQIGWIKDGMPEETISNNLERTPFRNKVEAHLSKLIGIELNFSSSSCPELVNWHQNLYKVRNEIVHKGKLTADRSTAFQALQAYIDIRNYLTEKLTAVSILTERGTVDLRIFNRDINTPAFEEYQNEVLRSYGYDFSGQSK